ncbi:MAG: DUF1553 domain-containing protein [Planctomycetales bacterium]|nr:DUF1553 domain-containing protein [Planctomycetales bacterium]
MRFQLVQPSNSGKLGHEAGMAQASVPHSQRRFFMLEQDNNKISPLGRCILRYILLPFLFCWGSSAAVVVGGEKVDFANEIQPILARKCYACHGPDQQEGGLRFDDRATLVVEADSGAVAAVPNDRGASELMRRIQADEDSGERMPPEGKPLSAHEIELLGRWIDHGAEYVAHWAFQPLRRPSIPRTQDTTWARQPLDQFTLSSLEAAGLAPVGDAAAESLIRRVTMDVTGLPPTPEVVAQLSGQWSEETYVRLVDRLLADPAVGERWARMWLDVVRYAETNGYERDGSKPNAWKYRDYVIEAMNSDKPYDQFVREQIAGDELEQVSSQTLTATGFYRLGLWDDEPADPLQALYDGFDDLVTTTSQGFLGLTLNCARCHDHKIDPLTQKDYYSLVALLRDVTPYGIRTDQTSNNQVDVDPENARRHEQLQKQRRELEKATQRIEGEAIKKMSATDQRKTEGREREQVLQEKLHDYTTPEVFAEYSKLKRKLAELLEQQQALPRRETVLGLARLNARPAATHVMLRGSPHSRGDVVQPGFPKLLGGATPQIPVADEQARSAGRRRVLADWLADDQNWLTSRVIVNRLWLHYFGRGIVRSPNNFGLMGDPPTHPALLDYLATELVRNDWQLKTLHRTILLSSTYRLGTQAEETALAKDPANNLFWRQNVRRLSAEQVRDSILAVTGQLNEQRYGESIYVPLSAEVLASQSRPGDGWGESSPAEQARRSIYIHVKRSLPVPLLTVFDFPDTDISCEARFLTTQPGQALTMLNSEWMQQQAEQLLQRVQREVGDDVRAQARRCLELASSRTPARQDVDELVDLVRRLKAKHGASDPAARAAMSLVVLNLNAFFYLD